MDDDLIEQWAAPPSPTKPSGWGDWDTAEEEAASWDFSTFEPPLPVVSEDAVFGYIEKFRPLINLELEEEKQQVMDRLGRWSLSRLQSEGLVVIGLKGRQVGSFFGKPLVAFELENRGMLPYHRFGSGDLVMISRNNPVVEKPTKDGQVIEATPYEIRVACTVVPGNGVWRLDRGSNVTAYQRMKAALKGVTSDLDSGSQFPLIDFSIRSGGPRKAKKKSKARKFDDDDYSPFEDAEDEKWLLPTRGTKLRSLLIDPEQHKEWAAQPSGLLSKEAILWAEELAVSLAPRRPTDQDSDLGLNMSQVKAVTLAIRSRLSLLQGPPGTGKTSTIVKFIRVLRKQFKAKFPILACAQSNVAVDNLLEGLHDQGVSAVRVGQPVKVRESLRGRTLDALLENHPTKAEIESVKRELSHVQYKLRTANGKDIGLGKRDLKLLTKKISKLREKMMSSILKKADVICSTCVGAGGPQLEDLDFPMVVLDEGSQCSEPEALIPIMKGTSHVVLVGDHFQLPPVCQSRKAELGGLGLSLFERLIRSGMPSTLLEVQYRMNPGISAFPSRHFYSSRLLDGVSGADRPAPSNFPFPNPALGPVVFFAVDGREESAEEGSSRFNRAEVTATGHVVRRLVNVSGVNVRDIGVVTPYLAQQRAVIRELDREVANGLEVRTVDGYQGREKNVIIFTTVRANSQGAVGFLEDWRRTNVAITRARRGLVVLGHPPTLKDDKHWNAYLRWLDEHGCIKRWDDGVGRR